MLVRRDVTGVLSNGSRFRLELFPQRSANATGALRRRRAAVVRVDIVRLEETLIAAFRTVERTPTLAPQRIFARNSVSRRDVLPTSCRGAFFRVDLPKVGAE